MRIPLTCDCGGMLDPVYSGSHEWFCTECRSIFTRTYFERTRRCTCPLCLAADQPNQQSDDRQDHQDDEQDAKRPARVDFGSQSVKHGAGLPQSGGV